MKRSLARVMVTVILGSIVLSGCTAGCKGDKLTCKRQACAGHGAGDAASFSGCSRSQLKYTTESNKSNTLTAAERKKHGIVEDNEAKTRINEKIANTASKQTATDAMSLKLCAHDPVTEPEAHAASPSCN